MKFATFVPELGVFGKATAAHEVGSKGSSCGVAQIIARVDISNCGCLKPGWKLVLEFCLNEELLEVFVLGGACGEVGIGL